MDTGRNQIMPKGRGNKLEKNGKENKRKEGREGGNWICLCLERAFALYGRCRRGNNGGKKLIVGSFRKGISRG